MITLDRDVLGLPRWNVTLRCGHTGVISHRFRAIGVPRIAVAVTCPNHPEPHTVGIDTIRGPE